MQLLTSQRNAILGLVRDARFDPREFEWTTREGDWAGIAEAPTLVHGRTGFLCAFATHTRDRRSPAWHPATEGKFTVLVHPGVDHQHEVAQGLVDFNPAVMQHVWHWLERIKREDVTDLWEQAASQQRALAAVVELEPDNAPFAPAELARVGESLAAIEAVARELHLTRDELKRIGAGVEYLTNAAPRMGRKDWFLLAVTLLTWTVTPDKAVALAQGVFQALQWVVHAVRLLP